MGRQLQKAVPADQDASREMQCHFHAAQVSAWAVLCWKITYGDRQVM